MCASEGRRDPFEILLGPRSVVVVGATNNPVKYGNLVVQSLLRIGFPGDLFLVNANREVILDRPSYAAVSEIPGNAEAAVIVVPAEHVSGSLRQCGEKGVRLAVVISGGFNELDEAEGKRLYSEMRCIAGHYAIRIIGPNTFGTFTPAGRFNGSFTPDFADVLPGKISIVSQSGGVAHIMAYQAMRERFGLRSVVGLGNRANVEFHDMVRSFGQDSQTAVIGVHLEGIDDPGRLLQTTREVAAKKPVLAFNVGKSEAVAGPARSHTGSLAGRYEIYRDGLRQAGLLWMETPQELMDAAKLFTWQEPIRGPRVAIMSIQAGAAIMLTDLCVSLGLELAHLSAETRRRIGELMPPKTYLQNPVDMGFMWMPPVFIEVAKTLLQDPEVDILIMYALSVPGPLMEMLKFIVRQVLPVRQHGKVLMLCTDICTHSLYDDIEEIEQQIGVPVYVSPERAIRSLLHKVEYEGVRKRLSGL